MIPMKTEPKNNTYTSVELFAGAGGMALGMERAGLQCVLLNEINKEACLTLRKNRPNWNVIECDVAKVDFTHLNGTVDILTGGFPCQAFSYAGKKLGFGDVRGTVFYEFARAIKEINPTIFVGENVRGLLTHNNGKTLQTMMGILEELGYNVLPPRILDASEYKVPQKRERLFLVGLRKDDTLIFDWPKTQKNRYVLQDALKGGTLFSNNVPPSPGQVYSEKKRKIMEMVPPGGCWKDLPTGIREEYMGGLDPKRGGCTGCARRASWTKQSPTLTSSPSQKMTEICHPDDTRPFTIREYARIQTFPDNWLFEGSMISQYKQIGNAVPVNLAEEIGKSLVSTLNSYYKNDTPQVTTKRFVVF